MTETEPEPTTYSAASGAITADWCRGYLAARGLSPAETTKALASFDFRRPADVVTDALDTLTRTSAKKRGKAAAERRFGKKA